jgi:hypothetical protein
MPSPQQRLDRLAGQTAPVSDGLAALLRGEAAPSPPPAPVPRRHATGRPVPSPGERPLTRKQKGILSQKAAEAYRLQATFGLLPPGQHLDSWRQQESISAAGVRISQAQQRHYLPLRGHFDAMASRDPGLQQFADLTAPPDHHDRARAAEALREAIAALSQAGREGHAMGSAAAESYALVIARAKSGNPSLSSTAHAAATWPPRNVWALIYSIRNRRAALAGRGSAATRNRSQRRA